MAEVAGCRLRVIALACAAYSALTACLVRLDHGLLSIADSSLQYDRRAKVPLCIGTDIREVWLENLEDDWVEAYTDPAPHGYPRNSTLRGRRVPGAATLPVLRVEVARIIPDRQQ